MATKVGSGSNLPAGGTHVWWWNNFVFGQVYSFSAQPLSGGYYAGEKQAQVTSVKYVVTPQHDAPSKTHIEIVVYNPGASSTNYDLYLTFG